MNSENTVAVVGLGYVGLPLALAFGAKLKTIGYDLSVNKLRAYREGGDPTGEMSSEAFKNAKHVSFTSDAAQLKLADFIVVAVPTPVNEAKRPDFQPLIAASKTVGANLKKGAIVIYESTVYPGATEEVCMPVLEKASGLKGGVDFKIGYSPERINPGDKNHTLEKIVKVTAGQDHEASEKVAWLYGQIIQAGVYKARSIKVAEAAKVIENTQRDLNIALMNELAIIFQKIGIDTEDVLKTAETKWNFLPFRPGLVGGHCIGVDPYYLTHKAEMLGYHPQVILAGRKINDSMGPYVAQETIKQMIKAGKNIQGASVLVMGLTFKENISDLRNSKVIDLIQELKNFGVQVHIWDPVAKPEEAHEEYGVSLVDWNKIGKFDAVVAAVPHKAVLEINLQKLVEKTTKPTPFIDVKSKFDRNKLEETGFTVWRL